MQKLIVRGYQAEDIKEIANIYYNTIHIINAKDYTQEQLNAWAPYHDNYSAWEKKQAKVKTFVAEMESMIVGFGELESNGHIDCFFVHHIFQGLGIGRALMRAIEREGRRKMLPHLYAEVSSTARPFFTNQGFQVIREETVQPRGVELQLYLMEKKL